MNKKFKPNDIVWIKNVNTPTEDAYLNLTSDIFKLYFPDQFKRNASRIKEGEIIHLHQNVRGLKVFTHLVTPIDNMLAEIDNTRLKQRAYRNVKIIAITPPSDLIPVSSTLWKNVKFQGIGQGNACYIKNIGSIGDNYFELVEDVWNRFAHFFR